VLLTKRVRIALGAALLLTACGAPTSPSLTPAALVRPALHLFAGKDREHGRELWVTDGTAAGTRLLMDIRPGSPSSEPSEITLIGDRFFLRAGDGHVDAHGFADADLWTSDGTPEGSRPLKRLRLDYEQRSANILEFQGRAHFTALDSDHGRQIWKTDGTPQGTVRVTDCKPDHAPVFTELVAMDERRLFFVTGRQAVWVTDGTQAGTQLLANGGRWWWVPGLLSLTPLRGVAYFYQADDSLFRSDGTREGTWRVALRGLPLEGPRETPIMAVANDNLFLLVRNDELWRSRGTAETTSRLPGLPDRAGIGRFATASSTLIVFAQRGLYASDGTSAGTRLVAELAPPAQAKTAGPYVYFTPHPGSELWRTDGTAAGTVRLHAFPEPVDLLFDDPRLGQFLLAESAGGRVELWRSQGGVADTELVATLDRGAIP